MPKSGTIAALAGAELSGFTVKADTVNESSTDTGVTVDGVLIKDGAIPGSGVVAHSDVTQDQAAQHVPVALRTVVIDTADSGRTDYLVYTTWAAAWAYIDSLTMNVRVLFLSDVTIPAGSYNLGGRVSFEGGPSKPNVTVTGVGFTFFSYASNIRFVLSGGGVITFGTNATGVTSLYDCEFDITSPTQAMLSIPNMLGPYVLHARNLKITMSGTVGSSFCYIGTLDTLTINVTGSFEHNDDGSHRVINGPGDLIFNGFSTSTEILQGPDGSTTYNRLRDYNSTTPGDWTEGEPVSIPSALDKLAARVSGGGGGGSELADIITSIIADQEYGGM